MTEDDKKKQAAVLAEIAKLPEDASIEDYVKLLRGNIIIPEKQKWLH